MIIDGSDFNIRPYRIQQSTAKDFDQWLNATEKKILFLILGRPLTMELLDAAQSSGGFDDIFEALVNGEGNFCGLKQLLVPSIYSYWLDQNQFKLTEAGVIVNNNPQNTTVLDNSIAFQVIAWNDFVKQVGFINTKDDSTLWFFMNSNKTDFPEWKFTQQEYKNRYFF